jgi:pimeloyl-ACP methyl ester carboxylesterase
MPPLKSRLAFVIVSGILLIALGLAVRQLPAAGAGGLLHPARHRVIGDPPPTCEDATFTGEGLELKGWRCQASARRRGTLVYLHGIADNRASAGGVIDRFGKRGFDVVAYDSRAHGESAGDACTSHRQSLPACRATGSF